MNLTRSVLMGAAAGLSLVSGAMAADLPSRKAAPASYVKICDAYGAGFFYIPGTDTCLKVGGYVRVEFQYTPAKDVITVSPVGVAGIAQVGGSLNTTGTEVRGRIDLDARTPTAMGTVRTAIRLRSANTSGIRNTNNVNNAVVGFGTGLSTSSNTGITIESAYVQWAGFTFGVAPENYAMMPSMFYTANAWAGFPNGMKQIAYTATFGGGVSATIALEDRTDFGYAQQTYNHTPGTGYHLVANVRIDQSWGFAAIHGMIGNVSYRSDQGLNTIGPVTNAGVLGGFVTSTGAGTPLRGNSSKMGYAIGATAKFNLPMIAAGDAVWFTANYAKGLLGGLMSNGGLSQLANASGKRFLGGIQRTDPAIYVTSGNCAIWPGCSMELTSGWNVAMAATHYWAPQWRSNFKVGYVELNPPSINATANGGFANAMQWGKGRTWETSASLIYSPAKNFDIGLEVQYMNSKNNVQNPSAAFLFQGSPGLSNSGWTTHMRIERSF